MPRRPLTSLVSSLAALGAAATLALVAAPPAAAAAAFTPLSTAVVGDVTGDQRADSVTLGTVTATGSCAVSLRAGLTGGGYATTATVVTLPVRRVAGSAVTCPDLGVVLAGPTAAANRLAVTFRSGPGGASPSVQVFSLVGGVARYSVGFSGQYQPSSIGSRDLDGDGYGDVYERTDQGEGLSTFLVRATTTKALYTTPTTAAVTLRFVNLDHGPGVDLLLTTDAYPAYNASAVAVDGRTGTARVLAACADGTVTGYTVSTVDVNGDGWPDVRVTSVPDPYEGVTATTSTFVNRSQSGVLTFVRAS